MPVEVSAKARSTSQRIGLLLGPILFCVILFLDLDPSRPEVISMATLVGTPPNLSFARIFEITFPDAESIAFGQWLVMALPITVVLLTIVWLLLTRVFFRFGESFEVDRDVVKREYAALGSMPFEERAVLAVFAATAFG